MMGKSFTAATLFGSVLLAAPTATAQTSVHLHLQIDATSVELDQKALTDDDALKSALAELAYQNPRPAIYLTMSPGLPFGRVAHVMEIVRASGIKTYIVGHEVSH